MGDFTPSGASSPVNFSHPHPGLKQGTSQEFPLFTGTTRQPRLCCAPVALTMSSCAVRLPKIIQPSPKKHFFG